MKTFGLLVATLLAMQTPSLRAPASQTSSSQARQSAAAQRVVLETEAGLIVLEVDAVRAPLSSANFLAYVDAHAYDGSRFFRTVRPDNETRKDVPIAVVVADLDPRDTARKRPAIPLERTSITGLTHRDGTVSMGRLQATDSADTEFFICVGDQPSLDFGGRRNADGQGFAAFGRVVQGMEIVRRIWGLPASGQTLDPPVRIIRAYRQPA